MSKYTLVMLLVFSSIMTGCGKGDLSTLPSPAQIKDKTDTFIVGQTHIQEVYDALGPWNSSGKDAEDLNETVSYLTNDGDKTVIDFKLICDDGSQDCIPSAGYDPSFPAHMLYSGVSH